MSHKDAKTNLRAVIAEYLVLDESLPKDKILELLIDAVTKPTSAQSLIIQLHIKGTRANKLYRALPTAFTEDDRRFYAGIDDFRTNPEPPDYGPDGPDESDMLSTQCPCPSCGVCGKVTFTREEESFPYGIDQQTVTLSAIVDKGRCSACMFEFTDWRAESARDEAVKAHLSKVP